MFRSGLRIVGFYFLIAVAAILLQWFPVTGIFLMVFGGALIVGAAVHACLLHLGYCACTREISRLWLIVPLVYYSGGLGLHFISIHAAKEAAAAIEQENKKQRYEVQVPFSYATDQLVALSVLEYFHVDAAYMRENSGIYTDYLKYSYGNGQICSNDRPTTSTNRYALPSVENEDLFPGDRRPNKIRQCTLSIKVREANPSYELNINYASGAEHPSFLYRGFVERWSLLDAASKKTLVSVRAGSLEALPIVQFILVGCSLNDAAPSWSCSAGLMSGSNEVTIGNGEGENADSPVYPGTDSTWWSAVSSLGHALGLTRRPIPT